MVTFRGEIFISDSKFFFSCSHRKKSVATICGDSKYKCYDYFCYLSLFKP